MIAVRVFFTTDGSTFYAIATIDSDPDARPGNNRDHDWGIALVPFEQLTTQALVGLGWGVDANDPDFGTENGSPVWVTVEDDTTVYVDLDADPNTGPMVDPFGNQYDVSHVLQKLERKKIFDTNDNDQTGLLLYTLNGVKIATAWGQDPDSSERGSPFLDLGTVVPALPGFTIVKDVDALVAEPGDMLTYKIVTTNTNRSQIPDVSLEDILPEHTTYVPDSSELDGAPFPDDVLGSTLFPLDEGGVILGSLDPNESFSFVFKVIIDDDIPINDDARTDCPDPQTRIVNESTVTVLEVSESDDARTCVIFQPMIDIRKQAEGADSRSVLAGSDVDFEIEVTNPGPVDLFDVKVTDVLAADCNRVIGDLGVGESVIYSCTVNDVNASFVNEACVEGQSEDGLLAEDCDPSKVEVLRADIDIRKQAEGPDSRTVAKGSDVDFEIKVTNTGTADLTDVEVSDPLVPDCDKVIGDLAAGDSVTYSCTALDVIDEFTNIAFASGKANGIMVMDDDPSTVKIRRGGEGCTPGFWKNPKRFSLWPAPYTPNTLFSDVFENAFPGETLLDVIKNGGGGLKSLGRHTVAALLNAASPDVNYDLSVDEVISTFNDVYPGTTKEYNKVKRRLRDFNEQGCPL